MKFLDNLYGKTSFIRDHLKSDKNYILYERNTVNLFSDFISGLSIW